jgi:uncharacterized protein YndB with AHSA1/START domain
LTPSRPSWQEAADPPPTNDPGVNDGHNLIAELDQAGRAVVDTELRGAPAHVVELRRGFRAPVADIWDACTLPMRICRWFLPLSGDLRPGGSLQLEGNAGGTITRCEPPHRLQLTWQFGDAEPSLLSLELTAAGDDTTELVLRHIVADDDHWAQFGPGAVGVGWDAALAALAASIAGDDGPTGDQLMAAYMRQSAELWGAAHQATGVAAEVARDAAACTSAFYAPRSNQALAEARPNAAARPRGSEQTRSRLPLFRQMLKPALFI